MSTPRSEKEKMLSGELYHSFCDELINERASSAAACAAFNRASRDTPVLERANLLRAILHVPPIPENAPPEQLSDLPWVEAPLICDYGYNTHLSPNVYINFNCTILDTMPVSIGARTILGPNVSLYAASHPLSSKTRDGLNGPEYGAPIVIEEDCWIAGNVTVLAGVRIGKGSVVGAGSVVTKDVPAGCVVVGNPARVVRVVEEGAEEVFPKGPTKVLAVPAGGSVSANPGGDVKALVERLERLEGEMGEVKEELRRRMGRDSDRN